MSESAEQYHDIKYLTEDGVAEITLTRVERRNAFTVRLLDELFDAVQRAGDDTDVRVVIVTGAGPTFSVGADLDGPDTLRRALDDDVRGHTAEGYREPAGRISELIHGLRIPVIGAVNGHAVGGAATILASMHVRIAAQSAKFGFVFTRRGVSPEGASSWFLPRLVGIGRATDWLVSGRVFSAAEGLETGYLTQVVPDGKALDAAREYAQQFVHVTSPDSVAHTIGVLRDSYRHDLPGEAAGRESAIYASLVDSADAKEGVVSFLEHRDPVFSSNGREA